MHRIRVECPDPLPLASTVAGAVFGFAGVIDRADAVDWETLTITSSRDTSARVRIEPVARDPLVLEVSSNDRAHAHAAALHLAMETHGRFA